MWGYKWVFVGLRKEEAGTNGRITSLKYCLYDKFPSFSINQKEQKNAYLKSPLELILTYLNSELFLQELEL